MALAIAAALTSAPFFCRSDTEEGAAVAWEGDAQTGSFLVLENSTVAVVAEE